MNATPNFRRNSPNQQTTQPVAPTDAQTGFINSLLDQIHELAPEVATRLRGEMREAYTQHTLTKRSASTTIESLKEQLKQLADEGFRTNRQARQAKPFADQERPTVPAGRYAIKNEDDDWAFYRVSVADNGRVYVRVYSSDATQPLPWKQSVTILRKIEELGVRTAQENFGKHSSFCYACGRRLTDEVSMELGIGPECRKRL